MRSGIRLRLLTMQLTAYGRNGSGGRTLSMTTIRRAARGGHLQLPGWNRGPGADEDVRTDYSYDASGNLTQITNALGQSTVIEYDERNLPTAITENGVARSEYAYDSDGNVIS